MAEIDLVQTLLDGLPIYGPQLLGLAALCCALGLPLPMPMFVLATGAIIQQGGPHPLWAIGACLVGSLLGETIYYAAGRYAGVWVQRHAGRWLAGAWQRVQERFEAQAALTVYLTRFLLTPVGIPTNLMAGSRRYPYWRFAVSAVAGDLMWVVGYGLAGYLLGPSWQSFSSAITSYGSAITTAVLACIALRYLWQIARARAIPHPRLSPDMSRAGLPKLTQTL